MLSPLLYLNGILSRYLWKNHLAINWPWNSCWINNCQSARLATFSGNCLELADIGILNHVKCQTFSCGCPEAPYYSNEMYRCRYSLDYLYGFLGFNWINILPLVLIQRFQSLIYRSCLPKCGIQLFHIGHSMSSGKVGICRTFLNIVNRLKHILDQIIQNESNNCCFFLELMEFLSRSFKTMASRIEMIRFKAMASTKELVSFWFYSSLKLSYY